MPKLPKNIQKAADEAEVGNYAAIPGGLYRVRVKDVETDKKSGAGNPKWIFQLQVVGGPNDLSDESHKGANLWEHAALTEAAAWKIKQIFTALGFTLDSDADELVGETCQVMVSQTEIEEGQKKGQMGNNIDAWLEDTGDGELTAAAAGKGGGRKSKGDEDY